MSDDQTAGVGRYDEAVRDHERRVAEDRPYEDAIDREEFRRRYGV